MLACRTAARRILAAHTDLRAACGLAARKPGLARTALTRTGDDLETHAPELLPPFHEECGRILAGAGSARAERVPHQGLPDAHAALCDAERFTIAGGPRSPPGQRPDDRDRDGPGPRPRHHAERRRPRRTGVARLRSRPRPTITDYLEESGTDLLLIESGRLWDHQFRACVVTPDGVGPSHGFGTYEVVSSRSHERTEARDLYDRRLIAVNGGVSVLDHGGPHCPHGSAHPAARRVVPAD